MSKWLSLLCTAAALASTGCDRAAHILSAISTSQSKARIELDQQHLISPNGQTLNVGAGMQIVSEIHQGKRTLLEYLLSPVSKAVQEAGREK